MTRYKLWLQVEKLTEKPERYDNIGEPICLGTYAVEKDAERQKLLVGYVLGDSYSLTPDEVTYLAKQIKAAV